MVRITVRAKIMLTILAVWALLLTLAAVAGWGALNSKGRGRYLEKHLDRFTLNLSEVAQSRWAAAQVVAADPGLTGALRAGEADQVLAASQRLQRPLQRSHAPDIVIISDAAGGVYRAQGAATIENYRATRLFQELRAGRSIDGKYAVVNGRGYMVSGGPVQHDGAVVGTVLLAYDLAAYFKAFAASSTASANGQRSMDPSKQYRPVLLTGDVVVAGAIPASERSAFVQAVKSPTAVHENYHGAPIKVTTLSLPETTYDFASREVKGFSGSVGPDVAIGTLYLVRSRNHVEASKWSRVIDLAWILMLGAVIVLVVGYVLAVQITSPLERFIVATDALARGEADLTTRLEVKTRDELGTLADNLNKVFEKIAGLAGGVQRAAFQVGATSGEVSSVAGRMNDGAKEQAARISSSTAAVTELSSSIQQVAENAASTSRSAKASGVAVTSAISQLEQIRRTVEDAAGRISTLGDSSKRIGNIVDVIRQISEQTTMLALNAAIEAAHAGEHGRGFAVVADEVSSLAKRVGQSARDIEDLIDTIRDQTGEAVRVMEDGSREVEQGTGLVTNTLGDLQQLIDVIDDTAEAVQEQAIASDEIARNMDAVQQIAEGVLAFSENSVEQGDRLSLLAQELEKSVAGFKVDQPGGAAVRDALPESKARPALPERS